MLLFFLKLCILIISNLGLWELLRRKTKVNIYFIPSLTIALQTSVLFLCGLLNLLLEATILITGIGTAYIIRCMWKEKKLPFIKNYVTVGFLFLVAVTVISAIALHGCIFWLYDDFSHWGLVVRQMLLNDRFPNFMDVISYKEYPIGSGIYIYYFSRLLGSSEYIQMIAQTYVMTACLLPLFSFCKTNRLPALLFVFCFTNFFFCYNIPLSSLLVDTMLPVVSACALLYMYKYCYNSDKCIEFYLSGAYLIQIIQIKNSGVFFVLIAAAWLVYRAIRQKSYSRGAILLLMPLISFILWHAHCRYVFVDARYSKHAMSSEYYGRTVLQKSAEELINIPKSVFAFAVYFKETWITVGFFLILGVVTFLLATEYKSMWIRTSFFCGAVFVVYQIGLALMYLFSMPIEEAVALAEIFRYERTVLIFVLYASLPLCMKLLSRARSEWMNTYLLPAMLCLIALAFPFLFTGRADLAWSNAKASEHEWTKERVWIEKQIKKYSIPYEGSYCLCIPHSDRGFSNCLCMYLFLSKNITVLVIDNPEELNEIRSQYILVYDENNEMIEEWVSRNYPDQAGNSVIINQPGV